jgi:hypothetical protein
VILKNFKNILKSINFSWERRGLNFSNQLGKEQKIHALATIQKKLISVFC